MGVSDQVASQTESSGVLLKQMTDDSQRDPEVEDKIKTIKYFFRYIIPLDNRRGTLLDLPSQS